MSPDETRAKGKAEEAFKIDLSRPEYERLAALSKRVAVVLGPPSRQANPNLAGLLDDLLGGIDALIFARRTEFEDRNNKPIEVQRIVSRAEDVAWGQIRTTGKWMAGFNFNSALFRLAAVYSRALKFVTGFDTAKMKDLVREAERLHVAKTGERRGSNNIRKLYDQVNNLKHGSAGAYFRRTVFYDEAISAADELFRLLDANMP